MKNLRVKIISFTTLVILVVLMALKLRSNKAEMVLETKMASDVCKEFPVKVKTISKTLFSETITTSGILESEKDVDLKPQAKGDIVKIYKKEGEYVKMGEIIAQIDNEVLVAKKKLAIDNYNQCQLDYTRYKNLLEKNAITQQQFEQVKVKLSQKESDKINAIKNLENTYIKSPINGYLNKSNLKLGGYVSNNSVVCNIVNINNLLLKVKVSENEIVKIKNNLTTHIKISTLPSKVFEAKIKHTGVKADEAQKYTIHLSINNPNNQLKAGMYANVEIKLPEQEKILIDRRVIDGSIQNAKVFLIENNTAKIKSIKIGETFNNKVEVLEGLKQGDVVAFSGKINLDNGTKVKIVK